MSGAATPSPRLSRTTTLGQAPKRRKAFSWSSAQMRVLERHTSRRTDLRLYSLSVFRGGGRCAGVVCAPARAPPPPRCPPASQSAFRYTLPIPSPHLCFPRPPAGTIRSSLLRYLFFTPKPTGLRSIHLV